MARCTALTDASCHLEGVLVHGGFDSLEIQLLQTSELSSLSGTSDGILGVLGELRHLVH